MPTIYRKTDKGHVEIETRAHRLPPRQRQALIVVDGRRSDDELRRLILQQPDEVLRALLDGGFIEAIGTVASPPVAGVPAPRPAVGAPSAAPAAPATAPAPMPADLNALKRAIVRDLTDLVGPMADALAMRIEKCRQPAELQPLLLTATDVIRNTRGAAAATAFAVKFLSAATPG